MAWTCSAACSRCSVQLGQTPDAWVQATALDSLRINKSLTMDELFAGNPAFGHFGGRGMEWVNLAFLAGGAFLLQRRVFSWHAPVGMLASLFIISLLCWNGSGSDSHGSPLFHLLTGATMLGAFFIVTEPVSGAKSPGARLLFGAGVGLADLSDSYLGWLPGRHRLCRAVDEPVRAGAGAVRRGQAGAGGAMNRTSSVAIVVFWPALGLGVTYFVQHSSAPRIAAEQRLIDSRNLLDLLAPDSYDNQPLEQPTSDRSNCACPTARCWVAIWRPGPANPSRYCCAVRPWATQVPSTC